MRLVIQHSPHGSSKADSAKLGAITRTLAGGVSMALE